MVLFLVFYVSDQSLPFFNAIRKCRISLLPARKASKKLLLLNVAAAAKFDIFNQICQGYRRVKINQDMQMILNAINLIEMTVIVFEYTPNKSK